MEYRVMIDCDITGSDCGLHGVQIEMLPEFIKFIVINNN